MKTHIILVRHGQTYANIEKLWHGWTDTPLNDTGREQAASVGARIAAEYADSAALYSSPLERTRHTADAISSTTGLPVTTVTDIREYGIGELEGESFIALREEHKFFENIKKDPHFAPKNGESIQHVAERMTQALCDLARQHQGEKIIAVSHGAALGLALGALLDDDFYAWNKYLFSNTSVTELAIDTQKLGSNGATAGATELIKFNCVAHLD